MTKYSEDEQLYNDLDWYAVDKEDRIGHFMTAGFRLLPPKIALSKENLEKLSDYFENLPFTEGNFVFCPELEKNIYLYDDIHLYEGQQIGGKDFKTFSQKMASRGLYSFDTNDYTKKSRPYFRIAIPRKELRLEDLPAEIREILNNLKMDKIDFAKDSVIPDDIADEI